MIVKFLNDDFSYYERIFANVVYKYVELSDMDFISNMINVWGNFQDAKNYVSLSITTIFLEFHIW